MTRPHIVIVDDSPANIQILMQALARDYKLTPFSAPLEALAFLKKYPSADLVLLDIDMPECNGYEAFRRIKQIPTLSDVPVIFVTARTDVESEISAFDLGIVDYIKKPIFPAIAKKRIDFQVSSRLREKNIIEESGRIKHLTEVTIKTLVALVDRFDDESDSHINRIMAYVTLLAETMAESGVYQEQIDADFIVQLRLAASFHDCGKVYISGDIMQKPDRLTGEEKAEMQRHAELGSEIMKKAREMMAAPSFYDVAEQMVLCSHERWDGEGYPLHLKATEIPLSARIMAVADVYDALVRKRPYKPALPHQQAVSIILGERGKAFDPAICDVFENIQTQFEAIFLANP